MKKVLVTFNLLVLMFFNVIAKDVNHFPPFLLYNKNKKELTVYSKTFFEKDIYKRFRYFNDKVSQLELKELIEIENFEKITSKKEFSSICNKLFKQHVGVSFNNNDKVQYKKISILFLCSSETLKVELKINQLGINFESFIYFKDGKTKSIKDFILISNKNAFYLRAFKSSVKLDGYFHFRGGHLISNQKSYYLDDLRIDPDSFPINEDDLMK